MPTTRNESIIHEIIEAIKGSQEQEEQLFQHFKNHLIMDAGSIKTVMAQAETLRLAITEEEAAQVLDLIGLRQMPVITLDHVDEVTNELFPDRFIEP